MSQWPDRFIDTRRTTDDGHLEVTLRWSPDLPDQVSVWRELHSYSPLLDAFVDRVRSMAEGLTNVSVQISHEYEDGAGLWVVGDRPLTDDDRKVLDAARQRDEAKERAQYERLAAKYAEVDR